MYARADWESPSSKGRCNVGEGSSNAKRGGQTEEGKGKGKPQGRGKVDRSKERKPRNLDMSEIKYYNCNEVGHFAKNCPEPNKREIKTNLAKQEDERPGLLMAEVCDLVEPNKREIKANLAKQEDERPGLLMAKVCDLVQTAVVKPNRKVLLHENKVIKKLSRNKKEQLMKHKMNQHENNG